MQLGVVSSLVGVGLIVVARREFARYDQPTDPGHPTSRLVTTGVFAISRNPLYLGDAWLFLGIALFTNVVWAVGGLVLSLLLCHYILIVPEERHLAAKFGAEYKTYAATVRRWWGRKRTAKG